MLQIAEMALITLKHILYIVVLPYVRGALDDACTLDSDCTSVVNAICTDSMCKCNHDTGHGPDGSNTACNQVCGTDQLYCTNGNCVDQTVKNNGINDCGDNTDEGPYKFCPKKFVPSFGDSLDQMKCTDGTACVLIDFMNDGAGECSDDSDEKKTIGTQCIYQFQHMDPFTCTYWMDDSQCVDDGGGSSGTCQCRSGAYEQDDKLGCTVRVMGDPCNVDPDCEDAVTYTECVGGVCVCDTGHKLVGNTCPWRELGDTCLTDADCSTSISNSNCTNIQCMCDSGYKEAGTRTCRLRVIEDVCDLDTDCNDAITNSLCDANNRCEYNYISNTAGSQCNPRKLTESCVADDHCIFGVPNSHCQHNTCQCDSGYYGDPVTLATCTLRQINDATCNIDTDCSDAVEHSNCDGITCLCNAGYYPSSNLRSCIMRIIGDSCSITTDCDTVINHSFCESGSCGCVSGYNTDVDNSGCYRRIPCTTDADCVDVQNAECIEGVCDCPLGYYMDDSANCAQQQIGTGNCTVDAACTMWFDNSHCHYGVCQCLLGYLFEDPICVYYELGGPCPPSRNCEGAIPHSQCSGGKCICDEYYRQPANTTYCQRDVVQLLPSVASWKCEVLWDVVVDSKEYLVDVAWYIVHETTLLDDLGTVPEFLLPRIQAMPREKYLAFVLGYHWDDDVSSVMQDIKIEVCKVADTTSLADLENLCGYPLMGVGAMVQPAQRKAIFAYVFEHTNLLKQRMNDMFGLLAAGGYPQFPLQINRASLSQAVDAFMDAVHALFFNTVEGVVGKEVTQEVWKETKQKAMEFVNTLLDADSRDELLTIMGKYSGRDSAGISLDMLFDVADHRDLYLRAFDLLSEWITAVTEIGFLDLPLVNGGYEQLYGNP